MIKQTCFSREWISNFKKRKKYKSIQSHILEKMIYALYLLILLKQNGLGFVFKGGTSLILLIQKDNRFSIDIDIICPEKKEILERIFDEIIIKSTFSKFEFDSRRSYRDGIPKAHYQFEFESVYDKSQPGKILLDILREKQVYPTITEIPVITKWIEVEETIKVKVPTIDSITGDKLTAFAPDTIGIPYDKNGVSFSMQICKQLFDLSKLFSEISDLKIVYKSFQNIANKEIQYKSKRFNEENRNIFPDDVLRNTINTCKIITKGHSNKDLNEKNIFNELQNGIRSFRSYLITGNFRWEEAVVASSKVAYLATKLLIKDFTQISFYNDDDIKKLSIDYSGWEFLKKLKRQPDKSSFYYWFKSIDLLDKHDLL